MKNSSSLIAFISALSLHLILGSVLLMSVDFALPKEKPKGVVINASVVNQKLFDDLAQRKANKKLAEKRKIEKARQEKKARENKRKKIAKEKALRKQREIERIKAEKLLVAKKLKAEKAKKLAESKLRKKEAARIEAEKKAIAKQKKVKAERLKAEKAASVKAAKIKAEKEAKIKAEKEAKIKAKKIAKQKADENERLRQAELDKQMEAEFADEFSSAQSSKQLSEIARYKALIQNKISRNWTISPEMKGKTCTLAIRLAPDGLVLSVNRSRGDKKLCASAKRATLKAQTLPIPKDPEISQQFRDFDITLEPDL